MLFGNHPMSGARQQRALSLPPKEGRVVAYDLARLFIGPIFSTPRGIDRVDLALAKHVFDQDESPNLGILPTPWGVRAYPAQTVRRWLSQLQMLWAENLDIGDDLQLRALIENLRPLNKPTGAATLSSLTHSNAGFLTIRNVARLLAQFGSADRILGSKAQTSIPKGAAYLNIGQLGLAVPAFHHWLARRADITTFMMLHDTIPIEFPHLVPAGADAHHARMIRTAARYADCLILNSKYTQARVAQAMERLAQRRLPGMVRPLPLPKAFMDVATGIKDLAHIDYFVIVSAIEPRKNHALLLRIWDRLIASLGGQAPHLMIVGSRGHAAHSILAPFEAQPALRERIHIISGLSSPALAALVLGASAMLCPSFVEGFGLPIQEANALGVPTLASDIPAHREVGNADTIFLPCDDDAAWESAILAARGRPRRPRPEISSLLTEASYAADILNFIHQFPGGSELSDAAQFYAADP